MRRKRKRQNVGVLGHKEHERSSETGFTMAELLVVVAIIAVLVAIAIPVFTTQLEKSREATDLANTRSAYAAFRVSQIDGTNPDGSAPGSVRPQDYFVYTGSGFVLKTSSFNVDDAVLLESSAGFSLLSDFAMNLNDYYQDPNVDPLPSLKGHVLVAIRTELTDYKLVLYPASWINP